ncbi:MAG: DUF1015 domain-containing protein, partial [bacterium]|nr:DUF1015 domain-containing protein [bacterium]MDW8164642.1 DUF1015 domain-containing protein [Candidatus Omnitrophota bacterium]
MAEFLPFRGFLYNLEKVKDISNVISPPWDLIDDEIDKKLISLSEYNIVKLIRKENNPEEVKKTLSNWLKNKILIQDGKEYFYFLKSKFEYDGKIYERKGIIGILGVEDFGKSKIIPHEKIFPKYSNNRYKLIEISRANFCPIFMLYQDKEFQVEKIIEKGKVYFKGKNNGENIEFGKIKEKEDIEKIKEILKEKIIFIADGHHRFYASF